MVLSLPGCSPCLSTVFSPHGIEFTALKIIFVPEPSALVRKDTPSLCVGLHDSWCALWPQDYYIKTSISFLWLAQFSYPILLLIMVLLICFICGFMGLHCVICNTMSSFHLLKYFWTKYILLTLTCIQPPLFKILQK